MGFCFYGLYVVSHLSHNSFGLSQLYSTLRKHPKVKQEKLFDAEEFYSQPNFPISNRMQGIDPRLDGQTMEALAPYLRESLGSL